MSDRFREEMIDGLRSLRAFALTFHKDPARAEDLVQDTMLKAWSKRDQFQAGTNMRAWLFTILRNTYLSERRKLGREVEDVDGAYAAAVPTPAPQDSHMDIVDLRSALQQLSDDQREALLLVGAAGFSYDEAARIVGSAPGTVKSRVSRARIHLAKALGLEQDSMAVLGQTGLDPSVAKAAQMR